MTIGTQWPDTPFMNQLSAPLLRRAAFFDDAMMFIHPEILPWEQLCELDLLGFSVSVGFNEYADILQKAQRMRKLRIAVDRELESDEPIVLDNLEFLHIIEHGASPDVPQYRSLMCGKLIELRMEYIDDSADNDYAEYTLADILGEVNQLRSLYLQNVPLSEDGLKRTLDYCPHLTSLAIINNESSGFNLPLTDQALLQLTISPNCTPLPELEHVSFVSRACSDFRIEKFIASRWDIPNNRTRLRSFVFSSIGMGQGVTLRPLLGEYIREGLFVELIEENHSSHE